jgi:hypothetical protein
MMRISRIALGAALSFGLAAGSVAPALAQETEAVRTPAIVTGDVVIELNGEAEGAAVLRGAGEQTEIVIELVGAPADASLQGYLVTGSCGDDGDMVAQLGTLATNSDGAGQLTAVLPLALEAIASAEITVEVRPEGEAPAAAVACGTHSPEHGHEPEPTAPSPEPLPEEIPQPEDSPQPEEEPVPPASRR